MLKEGQQVEGTLSAKERSKRRKLELIPRLTDNARLITALAFYCGRMRPGEWIRLQKTGESRVFTWRAYLKAARLALGIMAQAPDSYRLPLNYLSRLRTIGVDLILDWDARVQFEALNKELEIDDAIEEFSRWHPRALERLKNYLEFGFPQAKDNE